ncbi:heme lyase CcmF/NrfE family subunit [Aristophania vespae]|uniref:heme lyase CcmF/NrfE family subunit n=1 Tax=Aristophania vespae TaxID=2697033 RepID=UPI0023513D21|nr:heme lyase CcmF/NrfE family subunit [Aristophania vespae]UMM64460.1 Cytochrome c-type biogenesis protein CcmF [Aristophania vespae]
MLTLLGPEEGLYALCLGTIIAIWQCVLPLWGLRTHRTKLVILAPFLAIAQTIALSFSFICLIIASVGDDFSVRNIAENSAINKPLLYKITGVWGNHEGSILLWILILGFCGFAVALSGWRKARLPLALRARVLAILGAISGGFGLFCILTSNPFERLYPVPVDGQGMNPLLQDPGLAFHPPILYTGYVGFAVPFAFAVAALMEGRVDALWGRWVRNWTVAAWAFLTCGITLGSWWSYYVLGWGGYWFWDPVENASLIPWLSGTALLHSAIVVEKRESLKIWTILLALACFSFSLSGTFLVRSGILNSVHAFANDPARGVFILSLLGIITGGSLVLFAWKAPSLLTEGGIFAPFSREGALLLNNILLTALCAVVLTGTMYPPFMQLLFGDTLSVGKPFFDATTIPLTLPLLAVMGIGTALSWKRAKLTSLKKRLTFPLILALFSGLVSLLWVSSLLACISIALAIWVISASLSDFWFRCRAITSLRKLPRSLIGTLLAHCGVGITILGLCGMSAAQQTVIETPIGAHYALAGYDWQLQNVHHIKGENYTALRADIIVQKNGRKIAILHPEKRYFSRQNQSTMNVAIRTNFMRDLYAVLGDFHKDGTETSYILRLHVNPLAPWIWLGGILIAIGGFISLTDRRFHKGASLSAQARREKKSSHVF